MDQDVSWLIHIFDRAVSIYSNRRNTNAAVWSQYSVQYEIKNSQLLFLMHTALRKIGKVKVKLLENENERKIRGGLKPFETSVAVAAQEQGWLLNKQHINFLVSLGRSLPGGIDTSDSRSEIEELESIIKEIERYVAMSSIPEHQKQEILEYLRSMLHAVKDNPSPDKDEFIYLFQTYQSGGFPRVLQQYNIPTKQDELVLAINNLASKLESNERLIDMKKSNAGIVNFGKIKLEMKGSSITGESNLTTGVISTGNRESLDNYLTSIGVSKEELDDLTSAFSSMSMNSNKDAVDSWVEKVKLRLINGSNQVSIATLGGVLSNAINKFLGG